MPRTLLPAAQVVTTAGLAPTRTAMDGVNGNSFANNGKQTFNILNGSGAPVTLTVQSYPKGNAPGGLTTSDLTVTVAAGATKEVGPFPPSIYNDVDERVEVDISLATSVTVAITEHPTNPN